MYAASVFKRECVCERGGGGLCMAVVSKYYCNSVSLSLSLSL